MDDSVPAGADFRDTYTQHVPRKSPKTFSDQVFEAYSRASRSHRIYLRV